MGETQYERDVIEQRDARLEEAGEPETRHGRERPEAEKEPDPVQGAAADPGQIHADAEAQLEGETPPGAEPIETPPGELGDEPGEPGVPAGPPEEPAQPGDVPQPPEGEPPAEGQPPDPQ